MIINSIRLGWSVSGANPITPERWRPPGSSPSQTAGVYSFPLSVRKTSNYTTSTEIYTEWLFMAISKAAGCPGASMSGFTVTTTPPPDTDWAASSAAFGAESGEGASAGAAATAGETAAPAGSGEGAGLAAHAASTSN